ncbi:hypothetical protein BJV82DRAFT_645760 [Fennellomyces sp. T-0311]|nr:hypothetical protein BJV82DRAFT_645760 [Fennellomyces sp. T-0311]
MILRESMSRSNFNPIIGMGSVAEEGIIWHMEFLHTETSSRDRILLALMVYSDVDHQCRTIVYAVDASNPDDVLIERIGRLPLDTSTPIPILLIPLRHHPEALVLLTEYEAGIITTDDIACGNMLYPTCPIERPFGEVKYDGSLYKMLFPSNREIRWKVLDPINPVAPAMCILGSMVVEDEVGEREPYLADVLLYSGEGADSQITVIDRSEYTMNLNFTLQTFINRAPIIDSRVASAMMDEQSTIVCCSGLAKQGGLTLVSRGVQSSLYHKSASSWQGFTWLWNAQMSTSESVAAHLLVASSALETRLMLVQGNLL